MFGLKPYSSSLLVLAGVVVMVVGFYFIFLRPPLLPEDLRYLGTTLSVTDNNIPELSGWLKKVFWVMGSYIFTTGFLLAYIAVTSFRTRTRGALFVATIAGFTSIGFMTVVNFIIGSDFKWTLLALTFPWAISLILYRLHK